MRGAILLLVGATTLAAAPAPKPASVAIRTAGDMAEACTLSPAPANAMRFNFCNGFAQGVLQAAGQNPSGPQICLPKPAPKRSETMKEFATWVGADSARKSELASVGFTKFMAGRFPCKEKTS